MLRELKGEGVKSAAVAAVWEAGMEERVVFTCFHLDRIRAVKAIDASLRTGAIFTAPLIDEFRQRIKPGDDWKNA